MRLLYGHLSAKLQPHQNILHALLHAALHSCNGVWPPDTCTTRRPPHRLPVFSYLGFAKVESFPIEGTCVGHVGARYCTASRSVSSRPPLRRLRPGRRNMPRALHHRTWMSYALARAACAAGRFSCSRLFCSAPAISSDALVMVVVVLWRCPMVPSRNARRGFCPT